MQEHERTHGEPLRGGSPGRQAANPSPLPGAIDCMGRMLGILMTGRQAPFREVAARAASVESPRESCVARRVEPADRLALARSTTERTFP